MDVILTNKPEIFTESDVYDPGLSDHRMVYAVTRENAIHYPGKVTSFRSFKNLNEEELLRDLRVAPQHVGDIFDTVDDRYFYWSKLINDVLDNQGRSQDFFRGTHNSPNHFAPPSTLHPRPPKNFLD